MSERVFVEQQIEQRRSRGTRTDTVPPYVCNECRGMWTELRQSLYIEGRGDAKKGKERKTAVHSIWEFLDEFPLTGCVPKICPKCSKQKYAIYREIK